MSEDHMLNRDEVQKLRTTIQTVELTGNQLAILANAVAFNLVHNDCLVGETQYSTVYYQELRKLHDYIGSFVQEIIKEKPNGKNGKNEKRGPNSGSKK